MATCFLARGKQDAVRHPHIHTALDDRRVVHGANEVVKLQMLGRDLGLTAGLIFQPEEFGQILGLPNSPIETCLRGRHTSHDSMFLR